MARTSLDSARRWQLQQAKNQLSELVAEAERTGPQVVTRRGAEAVVVLSVQDFWKMTRAARTKTLVDVLLSAPQLPGGLPVADRRDLGRKVELE
jgi:antitoxin Phd